MIIRPPPQRPMISALAVAERRVIDARDADSHQSLLVELPVLVPVAAIPVTTVIVPLVGETDSDPIVAPSPELLDQPIVELAAPFTYQKSLDSVATLQKLRAIAPNAVDGVRQSNASR